MTGIAGQVPGWKYFCTAAVHVYWKRYWPCWLTRRVRSCPKHFLNRTVAMLLKGREGPVTSITRAPHPIALLFGQVMFLTSLCVSTQYNAWQFLVGQGEDPSKTLILEGARLGELDIHRVRIRNSQTRGTGRISATGAGSALVLALRGRTGSV
ncbi:hypothetical protein OG21DRAFT_1521800 [Imleria badia]|nr:hypothetical protein OG21DRAFT_1521800 [Imleria badia]